MPKIASRGGYKAAYIWDRPRLAKAQPVPRTPEQIAASEKLYQDFIEEKGWNKSTTQSQEKIADREARVAIEGDTDLNHDNVEAAE
jgi:hypothetical protein